MHPLIQPQLASLFHALTTQDYDLEPNITAVPVTWFYLIKSAHFRLTGAEGAIN